MNIKAIAAAAGASMLIVAVAAMPQESSFSRFVDGDGNISLPADFRRNMVHMGSWFVPEGEASGFHDVYTEASTIEAYRKTGSFPDGATLVKELRPSAASDYTTGRGVHRATGDIKQWFVMIRDTQDRFPESQIWGSGWGWALYKPGDPSANVATSYRTDCLGCHVPAQKTEYVYVEAYPTLSE